MCGIIGYTGIKGAKEKIIDALYALEYRGYDSSGLAVCTNDGEIKKIKTTGRVSELEARASSEELNGTCGIGHTRWATHGSPTQINAHPHSSSSVTLVHNGIIDNYPGLKKELSAEGYEFVSETDTECAAHLIDREYKKTKNRESAIRSACKLLCGSYAFAIIFHDMPDTIWAVRKDNPLIMAKGEDGCYVSSDIPALLPHSREIIRPRDNEIYCITKESIFLVNASEKTEAVTEHFDLDTGDAKKDGFDHFMLKEIHEEPDAIARAAAKRINDEALPDFSSEGIPDSLWEEIDSIEIVACGSATHAGLVGRYMIESLAKIPVTVNTASEYRYDPPAHIGRALVIPISQSGETADTLAALRLAKKSSLKTVAIVNAVGSAVARESDHVMYTLAGPEIAVATTKGYTTQVVLLCLIALKLALVREKITAQRASKLSKELLRDVPAAVREIISRQGEIKNIALSLASCSDLYYIGRGPDFPAGAECSLKLKEISYIHSEAYAAGELKHGTLSLVEKGTPVIALASDAKYYDKMLANTREVKARGADVILVCNENYPFKEECCDAVFTLPRLTGYFTPITTVVFSQLLAYETAIARGCDVDHPRNLAKSVTVE